MLDAMIDRLLVTFSPRRQRVFARKLASRGDHEPVETLIKMADGGFYWKEDMPGYHGHSARLAALEALGDIRTDHASAAYSYLKSFVSEYKMDSLVTKESEKRDRAWYSPISFRLTFPRIKESHGEAYLMFSRIVPNYSGRDPTREAMTSLISDALELAKSPQLYIRDSLHTDVTGSERCYAIYCSVAKLRTHLESQG